MLESLGKGCQRFSRHLGELGPTGAIFSMEEKNKVRGRGGGGGEKREVACGNREGAAGGGGGWDGRGGRGGGAGGGAMGNAGFAGFTCNTSNKEAIKVPPRKPHH